MNTEEFVVREGRLTPRPLLWPAVTEASIDFDVLRERIVNKMTEVFTDHPQFRAQYDGTHVEVDQIIAEDFKQLGLQMMNELWNRLRLVAETYAPKLRARVFVHKAPSFEGFEVPRFIASLLSGIGPLRIEDTFRETIVVYAPNRDYRDHVVNTVSVLRCLNALRAANVPLGTIQSRGSQGSFFTTCDHFQSEQGFYEVLGAFHFRHYTRNDIIMAMIFGRWGNPFEDLSYTLGFISDKGIVKAVNALPLRGTEGNPLPNAVRHVGGDYYIRSNGIAPPHDVPVNKRPEGIYVLGRGYERVFQCSLARNLTEMETANMVRDHLLRAPATTETCYLL